VRGFSSPTRPSAETWSATAPIVSRSAARPSAAA
jgi:hypothetical protein